MPKPPKTHDELIQDAFRKAEIAATYDGAITAKKELEARLKSDNIVEFAVEGAS